MFMLHTDYGFTDGHVDVGWSSSSSLLSPLLFSRQLSVRGRGSCVSQSQRRWHTFKHVLLCAAISAQTDETLLPPGSSHQAPPISTSPAHLSDSNSSSTSPPVCEHEHGECLHRDQHLYPIAYPKSGWSPITKDY